MSVVDDMLKRCKKALVDEYKKVPAQRTYLWDLMKDWLVDHDGNLTDRGKEIIAEVEAWEEEDKADITENTEA